MTYDEVKEKYGSHVAWAYDWYRARNFGLEKDDPRTPIDIWFFSRDELVVDYEEGDRCVHHVLTGMTKCFIPKDELTEKEFLREIGDRIEQYMNERHLYQYELAKMTGLSKTLMNYYIMGTRKQSVYNLKKIADALECSVDDLLQSPKYR